ncbi:MAG: hypothetical protein PW734_00745 [Verrucomicrobium sp.]|nr:hypothetical protein [Verrucomicrobium sp.]
MRETIKLKDGRQVLMRPAEAGDMEAIHQLYLEVSRAARRQWGVVPLRPWLYGRSGIERAVRNIGQKKGDYLANVVFTPQGELVGFVQAYHSRREPRTKFGPIFIRPDYRGAGLFEPMTQPMLTGAVEHGKPEIVFSVNERGPKALYEKKFHAVEFERHATGGGAVLSMSFDPKRILDERAK